MWGGSARLKAGDTVDVDGAPLRLTVNSRARRVSIRIDAVRGEAVAVAPDDRALPQAVAFARSRSAWIAERLNARLPGVPLLPGQVIPFRGRPVQLVAGGGRGAARLQGDALVAGGEGEAFARRVRRLLRAEALAALSDRTALHAKTLGQPPPLVSVMDARTRWGSCTPARRGGRSRIRYSWRLVLAPSWVLDYVAAHEAAHLVEANHQPAFWAVCERLYGDVRPARAWLKAYGSSLHAVG